MAVRDLLELTLIGDISTAFFFICTKLELLVIFLLTCVFS